MAMKFWGVEVKAKVPLTVSLEKGSIIHVSQVTLSSIKKDNETVIVHVKTCEKKLVLGMLSQKTPQLSFDLVFHEDFEISHDLKNGSIHLMGYKSEMAEYLSEFDSSDEEDEDIPVAKENGQIGAPAGRPLALKPQVDIKSKPDEDDSDDSSDDSEDEDDSESDDVSGDEDDGIPDMAMGEDDSETDSDEDDDEEESEEEKPSNAKSGKKRPSPEAKTLQSKKAKIVTPQKTDGKKGAAHQATPHPNKKGGDKTPKSGGSDLSCVPCKKTFKNDVALQSHTKAKHSAKK